MCDGLDSRRRRHRGHSLVASPCTQQRQPINHALRFQAAVNMVKRTKVPSIHGHPACAPKLPNGHVGCHGGHSQLLLKPGDGLWWPSRPGQARGSASGPWMLWGSGRIWGTNSKPHGPPAPLNSRHFWKWDLAENREISLACCSFACPSCRPSNRDRVLIMNAIYTSWPKHWPNTLSDSCVDPRFTERMHARSVSHSLRAIDNSNCISHLW